MIGNNPFGTFYAVQVVDNSNTAQQIKKYYETTARRKQAGLEGDGFGESLAAQLKKAEEHKASGEHYEATDSIGIILRQMDEPQPGGQVSKEVFHNGVRVSVVKDSYKGNSITIGGSANPKWIHVNTSVGTVNVDLNDIESLMKCLDMFSPEDLNAILREITKVRQAQDAQQEIDDTKDTLVDLADKDDKDE